MRILHLNTYDSFGGAARGTYFLHLGLLKEHVDSRLGVLIKDTGDASVSVLSLGKGIREKAFNYANHLHTKFLRARYPRMDPGNFSHYFLSRFNLDRALKEHKPDILHVHWVNDGFLNPRDLLGLRLPIVLTLRDLWFETGGCHYPLGCRRFTGNCGRCPVLGSGRDRDPSSRQKRLKRKLAARENVHPVAISEWMRGEMEASGGGHRNPVRVIPNCIPFDDFQILGKAEARKALGFEASGPYVVLPSLNPWGDERKGAALAFQALSSVAGKSNPVNLVTVGGKVPGEFEAAGVRNLSLEPLGEARSINLMYSCADLVLVPSVYEAFGKVTVEALACGRPVVAFAGTGADDIIEPGENGYLAANGDTADYARLLARSLERLEAFGESAEIIRESARTRFSSSAIARKYIELYKSVQRCE